MIGLCAPIKSEDAPMLGGYQYTVICNYYPEWRVPGNSLNPNPWNKGTLASRTDRHPLIGGPNNQDIQTTMDEEILTASNYGIDVFDFDWWWAGNSNAEGGYNSYAIKRFKQSENAKLMKFCVRPVVNGWTGTLNDFRSLLQALKLNFIHPSYYHIKGRPSVFWFGLQDVAAFFVGKYARFTNLESSTAEVIKEIRLQLGSCFIVGASDPHSYYIGSRKFNERVDYDAVSSWVQLSTWSTGMPAWNWAIYPNQTSNYIAATQETELAAKWIYSNSGTKIPYIPMIMAGRDGTPWNDGITLWASTSVQWENHCAAMKKIMDQYPKQSLRIISMYSWNEHGEGGIITPTNGNGYSYLSVIKRVFKS